MNGDSPERAVKEALGWLTSAKESLKGSTKDNELANVCCAEAIHAVVRANDALSLKFFRIKATRHDDAAVIFAKLVKQGKLQKGAERFMDLVASAMRDKSGADYGKGAFSFDDASWYVKQTEEFIAMVKEALGL